MKLAIVCANIGGIDIVQGLPRQNMPYDFYYYNETNMPYPLPNLNPRMRSKYIKMMMHRFLPDYDAYIWIDGKVQVKTNNFVELMVNALLDADIAIMKHAERKTPVEEIQFIEHHMRQGNKYLLSRYGNQQIGKEKEFLWHKGVKLALYETTLFIRRNSQKVNEMFNEWWLKTIEYSCFDQAMFSYISLWLHTNEIDRVKFKDVFSIQKHIN